MMEVKGIERVKIERAARVRSSHLIVIPGASIISGTIIIPSAGF